MAKSLKYGHNGYISDEASTTLDTSGDGDEVLTLTGLKNIHKVTDVRVDGKGYYGNVESMTGNEVTVRVYHSAGADDEMNSADNVTDSDVDVIVRALGY